MEKVKRERSANFTLQERDILIFLVKKYQTVLENKTSDATTWKKNEAVWENIQNEFNAQSGGIFRFVKTLKVKYEGLKRTVRKKSVALCSELYRTGGGRNTATPLDSVEEQIKAMISLSTDGLESIFDSNILPSTQENQDDINFTVVEEDLIKKPVVPIDMESEVVENVTTQTSNIRLFDKEENSANISTKECDVLPNASSKICSEVKTTLEDVNDQALDDTSRAKCLITPITSTSRKWDATSRKNLKSRKHPALIANAENRSLFDDLTKAKLELVQLQKELLEAEILEKKKEWEFQEKERNWKEEEYKLKLEKLKKELNE